MTQPPARDIAAARAIAPAREPVPRPRPGAAPTGAYLLVVLTAGAYLPSPLYPAYQQALGMSDLTMTLVYAMFALVSAPALLLLGPAADALGPRPVLRAAVLAAAFGSACFALASGPEWLLAGRAAQGFALGAATGAATELITRANGSYAQRAALASAAFLGGTAAGPVAGGLLAEFAPWPRVLPHLVVLGLLALGWYLVATRVPGGHGSGPRWRPARPRIPRGMRLRFSAAAASGFLAWTVAGLFLAVIPALLARSGQTGTAVPGSILGAVLICSMLVQPLVARAGERWAQLVGLGGLLVSLAILAGTAAGSVLLTLTAAVIAGLGHGLTYGGAAAAVGAVAPAPQRAGVTAAAYVAFYLGSGCPAVIVGALTLRWSLETATSAVTTVAAAAVAPAIAAVWCVGRRRPGAAAPDATDGGR
nr:MFS transporter [Saccharopolyspora sp. HNM0983]